MNPKKIFMSPTAKKAVDLLFTEIIVLMRYVIW